MGKDPSVLAVILFGSFARGDATPMSDADILIILSASESPFDERIRRFKPLGLGVSVDVFPLTFEEAKRSLKEGWGMVLPALKENIYLYRKDDFKLEDLLF